MSLKPPARVALPGPEGYCSSQLIPYLGNKRSLLPRLLPVFSRLASEHEQPCFLDCFSGSGAVSRLARAMGMRVEANDWEPYSEAVNACWLCLGPSDIDRAFGGLESLSAFLTDWNAMHPEAEKSAVPDSAVGEPCIARWYAPADTANPRLGVERLFYTAENATFIDRVRTRLENEYAKPEPGSDDDVRRRVILGGILLESAVHANTSGVFKAFHRGFGGNGKDALYRILGRMELEPPILPEATPAVVSRQDARVFMAGRSADIAYFDPPYNQHQYGSNYHLLNTILRYDRKPMPLELGADGSLSRKAGIPVEWKETRSPFCVKRQAGPAIASLLDVCDAANLVFSWNADGHLSGDDMVELLAPRGRLDIVALDYVSYRGGRQSANRSARSREYLFIVDTRAAPGETALARRTLADLATRDEALRSTYDPTRVEAIFGTDADDFPESRAFFAPGLRRPADEAGSLVEAMDPERRMMFVERLARCTCSDIVEELTVIATLAGEAISRGDSEDARRATRDAPRLIRKLAHSKYRAEFQHFMATFRKICEDTNDDRLLAHLIDLERLMMLRSSEKGGSR